MTWVAPEVYRAYPPRVDDERSALESWLDYQRQTLLWKCAGLTVEQLRTRSVPPATMSLLGLVRHMADVERVWFRRRVAGEDVGSIYWTEPSPDADFDEVDRADPAADFATYAAEVEAARAVQGSRSLSDTFVSRWRDRRELTLDLRWLVLHMIEEYARHNGHADLLRERIDGRTGL